jgi:hypothetical protein
MFRTLRRKVFRLAFVSGAGAAATYFLDRERGQQRREEAKQKAESLLKRGTPTPAWQPEQAANVFDGPGSTPAPAATTAVAEPTVSDIIATPTREVDPLASRP